MFFFLLPRLLILLTRNSIASSHPQSKSEALAGRATEMRRRSVDVITELDQSLRALERVRVVPGLLESEAPRSLADFVVGRRRNLVLFVSLSHFTL